MMNCLYLNFAISKEPEAIRLSLLSFNPYAFLHPDFDNVKYHILLKDDLKTNCQAEFAMETYQAVFLMPY